MCIVVSFIRLWLKGYSTRNPDHLMHMARPLIYLSKCRSYTQVLKVVKAIYPNFDFSSNLPFVFGASIEDKYMLLLD